MNLISKYIYVDKFDDIVKKYNNKYQQIVKMKSFDVKLSMYIEFNKENNK